MCECLYIQNCKSWFIETLPVLGYTIPAPTETHNYIIQATEELCPLHELFDLISVYSQCEFNYKMHVLYFH